MLSMDKCRSCGSVTARWSTKMDRFEMRLWLTHSVVRLGMSGNCVRPRPATPRGPVGRV